MPATQTAILLLCSERDDLIANLRFGLSQAGYVCEIQRQQQFDVKDVMGSASPALLVVILQALTLDAVQQLQALDEHSPCPVVLCVREHNAGLLARAVEAGVSTYIAGACSGQRAVLLAELATLRFQARQKLRRHAEDAANKLSERKLIERAKGILMETRQLSEQEAYRVMRKTAMNRAQPLVQVATSLIQASELLSAS